MLGVLLLVIASYGGLNEVSQSQPFDAGLSCSS